MEKAIKDLVAGVKLYRVWLHQAWFTLAAKYRRTALGTLWLAGQYASTSLAFAMLFGLLLKRDMHTLLPFAMIGNLALHTVVAPIMDGGMLFTSNSGMIRNHAYPFMYFSLEYTARHMMLFFHNLVIYYIFMIFNQSLVFPTWEVIPGLIIDAVVLLTWGTVIGMLTARFRDLSFMFQAIGSPLFFLTPVYWPPEDLGPRAFLVNFNPLFSLVSIVRMPIMGQNVPATNWSIAIGIALLGILVWFLSFAAFRRRIAFWI